MKILRILLMGIFIYAGMHTQLQASNQTQASVQGQLISSKNKLSAPGLTVVLVHQDLGRSKPAISDSNGFFTFYDIPIMKTEYYLEVYWGEQLIHRSKIFVNSYWVNLPTLYI